VLLLTCFTQHAPIANTEFYEHSVSSSSLGLGLLTVMTRSRWTRLVLSGLDQAYIAASFGGFLLFLGWLFFVVEAEKPVPTEVDVFAQEHKMLVNAYAVEHHNCSNQHAADGKADVSYTSRSGRFQRRQLHVSCVISTYTQTYTFT